MSLLIPPPSLPPIQSSVYNSANFDNSTIDEQLYIIERQLQSYPLTITFPTNPYSLTSISQTAQIVTQGTSVFLSLAFESGSALFANPFVSSAIPSQYWTKENVGGTCLIANSGSTGLGAYVLSSSGVLTIGPTTTNTVVTFSTYAFVNSGTAGFYSFTIAYNINN